MSAVQIKLLHKAGSTGATLHWQQQQQQQQQHCRRTFSFTSSSSSAPSTTAMAHKLAVALCLAAATLMAGASDDPRDFAADNLMPGTCCQVLIGLCCVVDWPVSP